MGFEWEKVSCWGFSLSTSTLRIFVFFVRPSLLHLIRQLLCLSQIWSPSFICCSEAKSRELYIHGLLSPEPGDNNYTSSESFRATPSFRASTQNVV